MKTRIYLGLLLIGFLESISTADAQSEVSKQINSVSVFHLNADHYVRTSALTRIAVSTAGSKPEVKIDSFNIAIALYKKGLSSEKIAMWDIPFLAINWGSSSPTTIYTPYMDGDRIYFCVSYLSSIKLYELPLKTSSPLEVSKLDIKDGTLIMQSTGYGDTVEFSGHLAESNLKLIYYSGDPRKGKIEFAATSKEDQIVWRKAE